MKHPWPIAVVAAIVAWFGACCGPLPPVAPPERSAAAVAIPDAGPPGTPLEALMVSAGMSHTCALLVDETVACWGANTAGQLGDGSTTDRLSPTPIAGLAGVKSIAAGAWQTCALTESSIWCWGAGIEAGGVTSKPRRMANLRGDSVALMVGATICAIEPGGRVRCRGWGGTAGHAESAAMLPDLPGIDDAVALDLGQAFGCAVRANGSLACFGDLYEPLDESTELVMDVANLEGVDRVDIGWDHGCVVRHGDLFCFGGNRAGQVGKGKSFGIDKMVHADHLGQVADVSCGWFHTCAIVEGGSVRCFGDNAFGQQGHPASDSGGLGELVPEIGGVVELAAGMGHTCILLADRTVSCFGLGDRGQLGDGGRRTRHEPAPVMLP